MRFKRDNKLITAVNNERGVSLVEVLAVLVLTVMITALLSYVLNFANTNLQQVSAREAVLQESRDIIQHITSSVRQSGFVPAGLLQLETGSREMVETSRLYLVKGNNQETIDYRWDTGSKSLTYERIVNDDNNPVTQVHIFSENVVHISFKASQRHINGPIRYTVALEVQLPNNQTRKTVTTILSSDRNQG